MKIEALDLHHYGGILAVRGAVSWIFEKLGVIGIQSLGISEDTLHEKLLAWHKGSL